MKGAVCIGVIAFVLLPGCGLSRQKRIAIPPVVPEERVDAAAQEIPAIQWRGTQFADVPIPPAFTLDYETSYLNVSGQGRRARVADLRYTADVPLTEALASVQQDMLRSGWSSVSLTGVAIKFLRFVKGKEECQLIIRKGDEGETVLVVRLHPRL